MTTTDTTTTHTATVNSKIFAGLLTDVLLFASKDRTLPSLCAVQLQGGTVFNGTDSTPVLVARATNRHRSCGQRAAVYGGGEGRVPRLACSAARCTAVAH